MNIEQPFPINLPNLTPLLAEVRQVDIDLQHDPPAVRLALVLEDVSAELLAKANLFEELALPDSTPLEPLELHLELVAGTEICRDFAEILKQSDDPVALLIDGPTLAGEAVSPFHIISNYALTAWKVHHLQLVSDEVLRLANKPPIREDHLPSGSPLLTVMAAFFQEDGWPLTQIDDSSLATAFQGKHGQWTCYVKALEDQSRVVFYSVCPSNVPENKRAAMAEFLTRANYGLLIGNFEFDFVDGEIRYKTGLDVTGDRLSQALIKQIVYANVLTMDFYLSSIMTVIHSDISPAEAIALVEN